MERCTLLECDDFEKCEIRWKPRKHFLDFDDLVKRLGDFTKKDSKNSEYRSYQFRTKDKTIQMTIKQGNVNFKRIL